MASVELMYAVTGIRLLTDGLPGVKTDFWHRRNTEIVGKSSYGFQLVLYDFLLFRHREKSRKITYHDKTHTSV